MAAEETLIIKPKVKIKVFGVGGGGNSVLMRMGHHKELDIDLVAINTDAKQLARVAEEGVETLQIGEDLTKGRGTGGNIALGEKAALDAKDKIREAMNGADLVFVTAGLGGGTGTGAAPVVAKIAHDLGTLSVGVVTLPFSFEGSRKKRLANEGLAKMQAQMDALILVANDNLMKLPENRHMTLVKAFSCADGILQQAINCVAELILTTGVINVDFADVTTIFRQSASSDALLGIGRSSRSAVEAVKQAVDSPLISKSLDGARGIILNLTGDKTLSLYDVDEATRYIYEHTDPRSISSSARSSTIPSAAMCAPRSSRRTSRTASWSRTPRRQRRSLPRRVRSSLYSRPRRSATHSRWSRRVSCGSSRSPRSPRQMAPLPSRHSA